MDLGLKEKCVIVTGASRGIGRAIAMEFAVEGANVAICARGREPLESTRVELESKGIRAYAVVCDLADASALTSFLRSARSSLGRVDILVNNASGRGSTDDEAGWEAGWSVDMMATVRASWQVVPWMEDLGGGVIIHISSISGLESGSPPAYAAVKAALISHSKTLAASLAPKGIRVNCVAPGPIEFPGSGWDRMRHGDPETYEKVRSAKPFGRLGTAEEVAAAVAFLASDRASWISGITLAVDGAQHKGNL